MFVRLHQRLHVVHGLEFLGFDRRMSLVVACHDVFEADSSDVAASIEKDAFKDTIDQARDFKALVAVHLRKLEAVDLTACPPALAVCNELK